MLPCRDGARRLLKGEGDWKRMRGTERKGEKNGNRKEGKRVRKKEGKAGREKKRCKERQWVW